jgi:zinc protease
LKLQKLFFLILFISLIAKANEFNLNQNCSTAFSDFDCLILSDTTKADTTVNNDSSATDSTVLPIPDSLGLTAEDVINTYVDSIGGNENLRKITDRTTRMKGTVQGVQVIMTIYQKAPDKLKQVIKAGGANQTLYFDGEKGFTVLGDKKIDITGSELEKLKFEATFNVLLDLDYYKIKLKLDGIAEVKGKKAYKIEMILPSGHVWIQYYDVKTGLKIMESKYVTASERTFIEKSYYSDYREVNGVKYPFSIKEEVGSQTLNFHVISINVNTGLIDREFEYPGD